MNEQQTVSVFQDSNLPVHAVSPTKYHLLTASSIYIKKGQKATGEGFYC
jgi:hypothetical protein